MSASMSVTLPSGVAYTRGLVASLGQTLRIAAEGARPDILVAEGAAGWATSARAAIEQGVGRILVIDPAIDDLRAMQSLADLLDTGRAMVLLSEGYRHNPAISPFCDWLDERFDIVTVSGIGDVAVSQHIMTQVRLIRALGVELSPQAAVCATGQGALISGEGRLGGRGITVRLRSVRSGAVTARQAIIAYGADASARLDLLDGRNARPAWAGLTTAQGQMVLPDVFESAHRVRLRLLAKVGQAGGTELREFIKDAELALSMVR
jgi:hypothetical protein